MNIRLPLGLKILVLYKIFMPYSIDDSGESTVEARLLKSEEVAEILHVSRSRAYLLMKLGDIPNVRNHSECLGFIS